MRNDKGSRGLNIPLGRAFALIVIGIVIGYVVFVRYWMNPTERLLSSFVSANSSIEAPLPIAKVLSTQSDSDGSLTLVCVLGPYQASIREYKTKQGEVGFVHAIPTETTAKIETINHYLAKEEIRAGEGEWKILVLDAQGAVHSLSIARRHVKLFDQAAASRQCVPYPVAAFERAMLTGTSGERAVVLIDLSEKH